MDNKEILEWCENWFDDKRKSNEMWRYNQDELTSMFLDEFKQMLEVKTSD
jgi:hypothetical protein